jgi:HEAT repeat protein
MNPRKLVKKLDDLRQNLDAQLQLIMLGEKAVEPLVEFLLSAPALHAEPRCLAAEALGAIGGERAIDGLIKALTINDVHACDPSIRLSEEVVRSCAAAQLGRLGARRAIEPLLDALERLHLVGAAEALARLGETRGIPLMIDRLEDPFIRVRIGQALLAFGQEGQIPLIETLSVRRYVQEEESRGSRERRAEATRLLGLLKSQKTIEPLMELLVDEAREVRLHAALSLCDLMSTDDHRLEQALPVLVRDSECGGLATRDRVFDALIKMASKALPHLLEALEDSDLSGDTKDLMIEVLAHIPDPRVPGALLSLLSGRQRSLHWKARWALQRLGRTFEPYRPH